MKDKDLLKILKQNGWEVARVHGSQHVMQKGDKAEVIILKAVRHLQIICRKRSHIHRRRLQLFCLHCLKMVRQYLCLLIYPQLNVRTTVFPH